MLKSEIEVGKVYVAKVSGKLTRVRVDRIRVAERYSGGRSLGGRQFDAYTCYDVANLRTGRKTTFRWADKFHYPAPPEGTRGVIGRILDEG